MDFQQLNYFNTLAEIQHFTQAAEKLYISQPTLSRSIAKLENHIGVPLFERRGRQVILNQYGHIFHAKVNKALTEVNEGKQEILDLVHPEHGSISIGFLRTLGSSTIPNLINIFNKKYPNVHFQFFQDPSMLMLDRLIEGEIDLCISAITEERDDIEWEQLWKDEIFAFVSNKHRLSNEKAISLKELSDDKFIALKKEYSLREITDKLFHQVEVQPKITFEGEDALTIMGFVGADQGVTLLPNIHGFKLSNVQRLRITGLKSERVIGLAWNNKRYLSPVAKTFKNFLINSVNLKG